MGPSTLLPGPLSFKADRNRSPEGAWLWCPGNPHQKAPDTTRGIPFSGPKGPRRPGPGGRGKPSSLPGAREGSPQGERVRGPGVRGRNSPEIRLIFKNSDFDLASGGGAATPDRRWEAMETNIRPMRILNFAEVLETEAPPNRQEDWKDWKSDYRGPRNETPGLWEAGGRTEVPEFREMSALWRLWPARSSGLVEGP